MIVVATHDLPGRKITDCMAGKTNVLADGPALFVSAA